MSDNDNFVLYDILPEYALFTEYVGVKCTVMVQFDVDAV